MANPSYDRTYRVRGIPAGFARRDTEDLLRSLFKRDGVDLQLGVHSLSPDPYSSRRRPPQVATVAFVSVPGELSGVKDEWTLPIPHLRSSDGGPAISSITIDTHFRGFTPLSSIGDSTEHEME